MLNRQVLRGLLLLACVLVSVISVTAQSAEEGYVENMLTYIEANQDSVGLVCIAGDQRVELNADTPFALASTVKLTILAEYARQVSEGILDAEALINSADVDAYLLPNTDGGTHALFMGELGNPETVTLDQVARGMMLYSSNAATDYIVAQIGGDNLTALIEDVGMVNTDVSNGYLGLLLALSNHESGIVDADSWDDAEVQEEAARLAELYLTDAAWREAEIAFRNAPPQYGLPSFETQSAYLAQFDDHGSAADFALLMGAIYGDGEAAEVLSPDAQAIAQGHISWLFELNPANAEIYDQLGTKGGSLPSILTAAWRVRPIDGEAVTLVIFYNDIPFDRYMEWMQTGVHQALEIDILQGSALGEGCDILE